MGEKRQPRVCIVVLNTNECEFTLRCVRSLQGLRYDNFEVVVVDNGSSDGSAERLRAEFTEVNIIQTGRNLGYTGGNNVGISYALNNGADYVHIVNPDTVAVNPDYLSELVSFMESHPDVGLVGPKVFLREVGTVQNTILFMPGLWRNLSEWVKSRFRGNLVRSRDEPVQAEALCGVCVLARADFFKDVGLLDEAMFIYVDEADLGYRARKRGWKLYYLPVESIVHFEKERGYEPTSRANFLMKRNTVYLLKKHGKPFEAWGFAFCSFILTVMRALVGLLKGENFAEHLQFCRRLLRAYVGALVSNSLRQ